MNLDKDNLENYIAMLSDDFSLVDGLSDEVVDILIKYLESEVSKKQKILEELQDVDESNEYI